MAAILWEDIVGQTTLEDGGYVGDLLKVARLHVDEAVSNGEITQEIAGQVFTAMIPAAFQNALAFGNQEHLSAAQLAKLEAEIELTGAQKAKTEADTAKSASDKNLVDAQVSKTAANREVLLSQKVLYERQTRGFDEAKKQKLFDAQINAWALSYSTGANTVLPTSMSNDSLTSLYNSINS